MTGPVAVICARAPPQISGTGTVMYELLRHFPKESLVLFSRVQRRHISRDDRVLPVRTFEVGRLSSLVYATAYRLALLPLLVLELARKLRKLPERPNKLLVVFPDLDFLLAGIFLSKLLSIPLFVYLHDCIVETATQVLDKTASKAAERLVFALARKVYSISVPMEQFYARRGLRTEVLPHGVDASSARPADGDRPCAGKPRVGFAGVIYETNASAIKDMVDAKVLSGGAFEFLVATSQQSLGVLDRLGVRSSIDMVATFPSHAAVLDFLSSCDVLFVPMGFESPSYKDLLTIFPTKVTDYWLAQRPIIVYGPREYAFVPLAEKDGYAKVVSERRPEKLAEAVLEVCASPALRRNLVEHARRMIEKHDSRQIAQRLMRDLGLLSSPGEEARAW